MFESPDNVVSSPDCNAVGMLIETVNPLRYDGHTNDPTEIAGLLQSLMPSRCRVLDVGCGTGSVAVIVNEGKGNSVMGIEPDADRVTVARSRGLNVHHGVLDEAFIAQHGQFDVVMASDVLEHVPSPTDVLALMIRATKPGGKVLISVPNVAHWSVRLNLLRGRFNFEPDGIMDATHLRWFTAKTAVSMIETSGSRLETIRQTAGLSLGVYHRGLLRRVPTVVKAFLVKRLTRIWPLMFGVQHVLVVSPA